MTIAEIMKLGMQLTTIARKEMDTSFIVDNQKSKIVREMGIESPSDERCMSCIRRRERYGF